MHYCSLISVRLKVEVNSMNLIHSPKKKKNSMNLIISVNDILPRNIKEKFFDKISNSVKQM